MADDRYRVLAGCVTVEMGVPETPGARARRDVRRGELLPGDVPQTEVAALLELGHVELVSADPPAEQPDPESAPTGSVAEVLAWVGDDRERAWLALAAESERSEPRSTLVTKLNALASASNE